MEASETQSRESDILNAVRKFLSKIGVTNWRNNTGMLVDKNGTPVRYGLCNGSSDIIGFTRIKIQPWHVGSTVAVFTALEVKRPGNNPTPEQANFLKVVRAAGGIAGVVRSEQDVTDLYTAQKITPLR